MTHDITIHELSATDHAAILKIANWYNHEWNTPIEKTIKRLSAQPNEDFLFQLALYQEGAIISTGGLCFNVNLLNIYPEFGKLGPWVALLYTDKEYRGLGFGKRLLEQIERYARKHGFDKIYLYTFTAVTLYKRQGWTSIATVKYKGHDTEIMEKTIK